MRRRELREHIFKLLFMTQFNSQDEMGEQVQLYLKALLKEKRRIWSIFGRNIIMYWSIWRILTDS